MTLQVYSEMFILNNSGTLILMKWANALFSGSNKWIRVIKLELRIRG